MAFPVTINGRTYTLADFEGTNYVDGFPDALEDFVTQAGDIYNSTSSSSVAIGTGSKTFTVADSGKPYQAGTPLRIADAAAPETNFMDCIVTSYSGTTLVVDSFGYAGSGTKSSWTVNIGGAKTVDGTLAVAQGGTGATTAAAAATNLGLGTGDSPEFSGLTLTGDASFGDNDKATFGASDDLQIYHDGSNTYIKESGAGQLIIAGSDKVQVYDPTFTTLSAQFDTNGSVKLHENGVEKLATTSTGIDVTGTITADGLTVDGDGILQTSDGAVLTLKSTDTTVIAGDIYGSLQFESSDATNPAVVSKIEAEASGGNGGSNLKFYTNDNTSTLERMSISLNGDISFYNTAGTSQSFFWDASAESLGIGTTSPTEKLTVAGNRNEPVLQFSQLESASDWSEGDELGAIEFSTADASGAGSGVKGSIRYATTGTSTGTTTYMSFSVAGITSGTNDTEIMRLNYNGTVGISNSSPAYDLHIGDGTANVTLALQSDDAGETRINMGDATNAGAGHILYANSTNEFTFARGSKAAYEISGSHTWYVGAGGTRAMDLDGSGNLLVGGTGTPTSSAGNIVLFNGTAPTGNATNGVILYAEDVSASSELKVRDEAGNVTTLSPHNFDLIPEGPSEDMAWSYYSERDGKRINVDMLKAIRVLEKLSGEKLVFEN